MFFYRDFSPTGFSFFILPSPHGPGSSSKIFWMTVCWFFPRPRLRRWSWLFNSQIPADFSRKEAVDFRVTRDGGAAVQHGIFPSSVVRPFADEPATMSSQMADEFAPFHIRIAASS
jgi:hypothetical protein